MGRLRPQAMPPCEGSVELSRLAEPFLCVMWWIGRRRWISCFIEMVGLEKARPQSGLLIGGFKTNGLSQSGMLGRQSLPGNGFKRTGLFSKSHEHVTMFIPSSGSLILLSERSVLEKILPFIVLDEPP
jgi:hypothetical protein